MSEKKVPDIFFLVQKRCGKLSENVIIILYIEKMSILIFFASTDSIYLQVLEIGFRGIISKPMYLKHFPINKNVFFCIFQLDIINIL